MVALVDIEQAIAADDVLDAVQVFVVGAEVGALLAVGANVGLLLVVGPTVGWLDVVGAAVGSSPSSRVGVASRASETEVETRVSTGGSSATEAPADSASGAGAGESLGALCTRVIWLS